jgi:hypothetical protein
VADRAAAALALIRMVQASHTVTLEQLPDLVAEHAAEAGLLDVAVYVVDIRETVLRRLIGTGGDAAGRGEEFAVQGTLPGQAYQRVDVLAESASAGAPGGRRRWRGASGGAPGRQRHG